MLSKRAESLFKAIKPTSIHTEDRKSDAWEEYRAEQEAALDRMARQRAARLSAVETLQSKSRA